MKNEIIEMTKNCLRSRYARIREIMGELDEWAVHSAREDDLIHYIQVALDNYSDYLHFDDYEDYRTYTGDEE